METLSARFTDDEAEQVRRMARLAQFPEGITSVLKWGVHAAWKRYGAYAEVLHENTERISEEAQLARTSD